MTTHLPTRTATVALCLLAALWGVASGVALRLPADLALQDSEDSPDAVIFRHTTHVARAANRCLFCHPQPFSILGRHRPVRHEEMSEGRSCGTCHNGRDARNVEEDCDTCHTGVDAP